MDRLALLFPGQGAQQVGMGKDLHAAFPLVRATYEEASDAAGFDFARLSFTGPESDLIKTQNAQPAILIHGVACLNLLRQAGIEGAIGAGHSLGEYTAHVAAGSLSFTDAVRIVRRRGELMYEAGLRHPGTMAAILGLSLQELGPVLAEAGSSGVVVAANLNGPTQVVVSGEIAAVEQAIELAKQVGAKRAARLSVSGAFHSPLMESAASGLGETLDACSIADPRLPVVANSTAQAVWTAAEARSTLKEQLLKPVRWEESMRALIAGGTAEAVELGPGSVLRGLMRSINPDVRVLSISDPLGLESAVSSLLDGRKV